MLLSIHKKTADRFAVEAYDESNAIVGTPRIIHRYKDKDVKWLASLNPQEWTLSEVNNILFELSEEGESERAFEIDTSRDEFELLYEGRADEVNTDNVKPATITTEQPFTLMLRGLHQLKKQGRTFSNVEPGETLKQAFHHADPDLVEPLIEWYDTRFLACLDVDYHDTPLAQRPDHEELAKIVGKLKCQPFCWHPSHGRGCKLYFIYKPGYTAEELAAVTGFQWVEVDTRATFDIIKSTRHPCYTRMRDGKAEPAPLKLSKEIHFVYGSSDVTYLKRILNSELELTDLENLLAERGWRMGQTLPHSECLIEPSDSKKDNVFVGEAGLYCHRCASRGLGTGDRPGFYPYSKIALGKTDNRLLQMVRSFTHLEHARIVLENLYPRIPIRTLETIYKCLLKIVHTADDPRIGRAMTAGQGFIRSKGQWVTLDGTSSIAKNIQPFVQTLPCTLIPTDKGFRTNVAVSTALQNTGETERYGYPSVTFIRGCKIYGVHLPYKTDEIIKPVVRKEFARTPPRYVPRMKRMPSAEAWNLLNDVFPGIEPNYVKLLICAKGAAEGRQAQCPFILVNGPSSSGKSTTPHIAAGLCGDKPEEPTFSPFPERYRANLMDAASNTDFVIINEVFKEAARARLAPTQALDPMLTVTEDSRSHKLYIGSVPFGRLPCFILTDITCPQEVLEDVQIARRFVFYQMRKRIFWEKNLIDYGIQPYQFRLISSEHSAAADAILSEVIDQFFTERIPLSEMAKRLEIGSLDSHSNEVDDRTGQLVQFYHAVCNAPSHTDKKYIPRFSPLKGWKKVDRIQQSELCELWEDLCDDAKTTPGYITSRRALAEDWNRILGITDVNIRFEVRALAHCLFVRFVSTDSARNPSWINGQKVKE